jgi:hypothetical protein
MHFDTGLHCVQGWAEDDILSKKNSPTLNNTADRSTKNVSEEILQTPSVKLVKPITNRTEMCNIMTAG